MTPVARAVAAVLAHVHYGSQVHTATKLLSPTLVVRGTKVSYQRRAPRRGARSYTYTVTIGAPNYDTRAYIKVCKRAGESFPVKKIWLRTYPVLKPKPRARPR